VAGVVRRRASRRWAPCCPGWIRCRHPHLPLRRGLPPMGFPRWSYL